MTQTGWFWGSKWRKAGFFLSHLTSFWSGPGQSQRRGCYVTAQRTSLLANWCALPVLVPVTTDGEKTDESTWSLRFDDATRVIASFILTRDKLREVMKFRTDNNCKVLSPSNLMNSSEKVIGSFDFCFEIIWLIKKIWDVIKKLQRKNTKHEAKKYNKTSL